MGDALQHNYCNPGCYSSYLQHGPALKASDNHSGPRRSCRVMRELRAAAVQKVALMLAALHNKVFSYKMLQVTTSLYELFFFGGA